MNSDEIKAAIVGLIFTILIAFLVFRHVVCWYWKINSRVKLQEKTNALLEKQNLILVAAVRLLAKVSQNTGNDNTDILTVLKELEGKL